MHVSLIGETLTTLPDEPLMTTKVSPLGEILGDAIELTNLHIEMINTTSILTLKGPSQDNILVFSWLML